MAGNQGSWPVQVPETAASLPAAAGPVNPTTPNKMKASMTPALDSSWVWPLWPLLTSSWPWALQDPTRFLPRCSSSARTPRRLQMPQRCPLPGAWWRVHCGQLSQRQWAGGGGANASSLLQTVNRREKPAKSCYSATCWNTKGRPLIVSLLGCWGFPGGSDGW